MDKKTLEKLYYELKEKYKIKHLLNQNKKYLFILESPHIDELLNEAPVSGSSGKTMSKVIFGENEKTPFGIKLKGDPRSRIGIMNICPIPMQLLAYQDKRVVEMYGKFDEKKFKNFFEILEKLRTNTRPSYTDDLKNNLQEIILNDFKNELEKLKDEELVIIPCGKTAETFFEAADVKSGKWKVLKGVPHPSFGNWHKGKYADIIKQVKNHLNI